MIEISAHVSSELDASFEKAMAIEYQGAKSNILQVVQPDCGSRLLKLCYFELGWPFFDANDFLIQEHALYWAMLADSRDATSRLTEQIIRDRSAESADREEPKVSLFDPVGSGLRAISTPLTSSFTEVVSRSSDAALIFSYLLEYRLSGNLGSPPIDHLTGQPFVVSDKGDSIDITSARLEEDEPAVRYSIKKSVR